MINKKDLDRFEELGLLIAQTLKRERHRRDYCLCPYSVRMNCEHYNLGVCLSRQQGKPEE